MNHSFWINFCIFFVRWQCARNGRLPFPRIDSKDVPFTTIRFHHSCLHALWFFISLDIYKYVPHPSQLLVVLRFHVILYFFEIFYSFPHPPQLIVQQAVFRKVSNDGKSQLYSSTTPLGKAFKGIIWMAFSLPFVPLPRYCKINMYCINNWNSRLDEAMQTLRDAIPLLQDPDVENWCTNFANYLEATWIQGSIICFNINSCACLQCDSLFHLSSSNMSHIHHTYLLCFHFMWFFISFDIFNSFPHPPQLICICLSYVCPGSFPPQEWNQYQELEMNFLTNNVIEGMNFRLISRWKIEVYIHPFMIIDQAAF